MIKKTLKAWLNRMRLWRKACRISSYETLDPFAVITAVNFEKGVMISRHASVSNSSIGKYSSVGRNSKVTHARIGAFCAISWDCTINALFHPTDHLSISAFAYVPHVGGFVKDRTQGYSEVVIGNDVWIGAQAIIMPGIQIGNGAIIGAGSVVTKSVAAYEVVCGNPARHLRWRFEPDICNELTALQWWTWSDQKLKANIHLFHEKVEANLLERLRESGSC